MVGTTLKIGKAGLFVNPDELTVKVGTKGKATPALELFNSLPRSERRKLRKKLRNEGYGGVASVTSKAA